jgi:hypothetical protein
MVRSDYAARYSAKSLLLALLATGNLRDPEPPHPCHETVEHAVRNAWTT